MSLFFAAVLIALFHAPSLGGEPEGADICGRAKTEGSGSDAALAADPLERLLASYRASLCGRLARGEITRGQLEAFYGEMTSAVKLEKQRNAERKGDADDGGGKAPAAAPEVAGPARAEKARRLEFLPERLLYRPYLADPRRPRFSIGWLRGDGGESHVATALGGYFPVLDLRRPDAKDEQAQIALFAGLWSRWDVEESLDQIGSDFRGGLSLSYKRGSWATRLQYFHESDHLGDELVLRTGRRRIDYRRDDFGLGFSYEPTPQYRLYLEGGYGVNLGRPNKPWRAQLGGEWEGDPWLPLGGRPFAALDLQAWEESFKWDPNVNLQLGAVYWNDRRSRSLRLSLDLYRGRDPLGEFLRERLRYLALGFSFDF